MIEDDGAKQDSLHELLKKSRNTRYDMPDDEQVEMAELLNWHMERAPMIPVVTLLGPGDGDE